MFLAFDSTRGWFTSWLSSTLGYCFSYPMAMLVVTLLLNIYREVYNQKSLSFADAIVSLSVGIIFSVLIKRIGDVTGVWFGSTNIADGTAHSITRMVSNSIGGTKMVGKSVANVAKDTAKGGYYTAKGGSKVVKGAYGVGKAIGSKGHELVTGKKPPPTIQVK